MNLILTLLALQGRTGVITPPSQPPGKVLVFQEIELAVLPKVRSASYVLQSNPSGVAELLAANGRNSSFATLLPPRMGVNGGSRFQPMTPRPKHRRAADPSAFKANFDVSAALRGMGIDTSASEDKGLIDFGKVMSNDSIPSRSVSLSVVNSGKLSYSLSGSSAFRVSVAKATEYVSGSDFGSGYEKTVEWSSSPFPVSSGSQVAFYVEFNQNKAPGTQIGKLSIKDGAKSISYSLKGEVSQKELSVKLLGTKSAPSSVMPGETVVANVDLMVNQNSGSQVGFKLLDPPLGISLEDSSMWVGTPGKKSATIKIRTNREAADNPDLGLTVAIYRGDTQETLATFPIKFSIARQWLEWSYKREAGKQDIWGTFQLANTGEFIWNVHAYNYSSLFSDQFFTAACFPGIGVNGSSPAVFTVGALPIGDHDTMYYQLTGLMPITDFNKMKTTSLVSYLAINEGGPLAALAGAGSGIVDLFKTTFSPSEYDKIPNNFGGKVVKWMQKYKAKPMKLTSAKAWL